MKKTAFAVLAVAAMALTACGVDNVATCKEAVDKINALDCIGEATLDADATCPDTLNQGGVDCTDLYTCIGDGYTCDDGILNADVADCPACG